MTDAPAYVNKDYALMDEAELRGSLMYWASKVDSAGGFPSAYFAARQCKHVCAFAERLGVKLENPHPIKIG